MVRLPMNGPNLVLGKDWRLRMGPRRPAQETAGSSQIGAGFS